MVGRDAVVDPEQVVAGGDDVVHRSEVRTARFLSAIARVADERVLLVADPVIAACRNRIEVVRSRVGGEVVVGPQRARLVGRGEILEQLLRNRADAVERDDVALERLPDDARARPAAPCAGRR
jgi:hypothetical protein